MERVDRDGTFVSNWINPNVTAVMENTYDAVKRRFQRFAFQTQDGTYGVTDYLERKRGVRRHTSDKFRKLFLYAFYFDLETPRAPGEKLKRHNFVERWIRDPHARRYDTIICTPGNTEARCYNEWEPFTASGLPPVVDPAEVAADVAPLLKHIREVMMNGVEAHLQWFLRWWAAILQNPTKRTEVCIIVRGEQGCGKSTVTEFFATKVLGPENMSVIQNAALDLFSRFSNASIGKSVVLMDEPENLNALITKLKFMITSGMTRKEQKGVVSAAPLLYFFSSCSSCHALHQLPMQPQAAAASSRRSR